MVPLSSLAPRSRPSQYQRYTVERETANIRATSRGRIKRSWFICFTLSFFPNLPFKIRVEGKDGCPVLSQKQQCGAIFW